MEFLTYGDDYSSTGSKFMWKCGNISKENPSTKGLPVVN